MEALFGKTLSELQDIVLNFGLKKFTAAQIASWLYKKDVSNIQEMTNLSKQTRELLEKNFVVGKEPPVKETVSKDGTKKYLFKSGDNRYIETAYIPDKDRATLCISSQTGCKMGCKFCNTGLQGFAGNLSVTQILNQIKSLPEKDRLTNYVFMGMGEPLDNKENVLKALEIMTSDYGFGLSPHRITLSTVGLTPSIIDFLEKTDVHLAISVHNPFPEERKEIMPIENAQPLSKILKIVEKFDFRHQRRFSAEYIMIKGFNDSPRHARELAEILKKIPSRVNLIRYHEHPGSEFHSSTEIKIHEFQEILNSKNIITTIRSSRGEDIFAACGLLSTKEICQK